MFGIDVITSYLLVVAIATLLLAVLVWQTHRSGRTVIVWLAASMLGLILGSIGSYATICTAGYQVVKAPEQPKGTDAAPAGAPSGMPGMGGMGGGMGMGMGGMGGPQPKRDLTTLVRKLDLLTGDIAVTLTGEQAVAVNECLKDVEKPAKMSDDEAKAKHDKLLAVFSDAQKARFEQIGLPRPAPTGGAGGPGGMPGMGGPGMGKSGMGGPGAPKQDPDQNPFQQDAQGKALKSLRERLAPKAGADAPKPSAEAPKPSAEAPKPSADKAPAKKS